MCLLMKAILKRTLVLTVLCLFSLQLMGNTHPPAKQKSNSNKNRNVCLNNQATMQKAVRGYAALNNLKSGEPVDWDELQKWGFIGEYKKLKCPSGGKYTILKKIPKQGKLAMRCSHEEDLNHRAKNTKNW